MYASTGTTPSTKRDFSLITAGRIVFRELFDFNAAL